MNRPFGRSFERLGLGLPALRRALRKVPAIQTFFLGVFIWLAWAGNERVGLTADEGIHVAGGLAYNHTGAFHLHPENGNLIQRWLALPWQLAAGPAPDHDSKAWKSGDVFTLADTLFEDAGPARFALLSRSRLANTLLGALLVFILYRWSHSLWGTAGGRVTLVGAAFCPTLLAHAGVATSDIAGCLGLVLASLAWWRLLHRVTVQRVLLAGLSAAVLALTKYSCVLLAPLVLLFLAVRLARSTILPWSVGSASGRARGLKRLVPMLLGAAAAALLAWSGIWAGYGFRYSAAGAEGGDFIKPWSTLLVESPQRLGLPQLPESGPEDTVEARRSLTLRAVETLRYWKALPEGWLYGLAFVAYHAQARLAYFAGEYSLTGWPAYFPVAWALKATVASWLLVALATVAWFGGARQKRGLYRLAPVLLLAAVHGTIAITGGLNIGLRHFLPVIAAAWVLIGGAGLYFSSRRLARFRVAPPALVLVLCLHVAESAPASPHHLTFFNLAAGAPAQRHRLLTDSNLDWGQGLPELARWLARQPSPPAPLHLSYFGSDRPSWHGLGEAVRFGDLHFERLGRSLPADLKPGLYAIGPTQWTRTYTQVRGPWTLEREKQYRALRIWLHRQAHRPEGEPVRSLDGARPLEPAEIEAALRDYDALTFGRFMAALQDRPPDLVLPGGMLLFHLDAPSLAQALGPPPP